MHSRSTLLRFLMRMSVTLVAMLATGTGVAAAAETPKAATEAETMSLGVLGPVGLAAVILGVVGMALGVLRQRRKAQADSADSAAAPAVPEAAPVAASSEIADLPGAAVETPVFTPHRPSVQ
ncbi:hypothetical protein ORV05_29580 [Amycolatopsis cynarae]|uniref:Secreted protein n=1 Tax=Amycolatopsis cynarae TaxID=2995223 RepID=A0ABY7AYN5_9PSEU|nr:hypothetical protein [Amycolatopsis sp. HUAS 11-8]WAL65031.1 hypothetical protein ORV05_29580 [Amycolatopsis sp. HUAS 11-8]